MTDTRLPDLPSDLIDVALADLEKCKRDPRYEVYMGVYHNMSFGVGVCLVCFAGGVIAQSLEIPPESESDPTDFDRDTKNKLFALDSFRLGNVYWGLLLLGLDMPADYRIQRHRETKQNYSPAYLRKLSAELRRCGH